MFLIQQLLHLVLIIILFLLLLLLFLLWLLYLLLLQFINLVHCLCDSVVASTSEQLLVLVRPLLMLVVPVYCPWCRC